MTVAISGREIAKKLGERFPQAVTHSDDTTVIVRGDALFEVAQFLKETPGLDFDYLTCLSGVDYVDYFELVYHLTSLEHNHSLVLKTRCFDREQPKVPSVCSLWRGADFQEREIYDLLGVDFVGHPNMKRIFLWEGFEGHPLRKDYL